MRGGGSRGAVQEHQALRARAIALVLDRLLDLVRAIKKPLKLLVLLLVG